MNDTKYIIADVILFIARFLAFLLALLLLVFPYSFRLRVVGVFKWISGRVWGRVYFIVVEFVLSFAKVLFAGARRPVFKKRYVTEKYFMNLDLRDSLQREIYIQRNYENKIRTYVQNTLSSGDTFVDVGANIGYYTLLASSLIGEGGKVISFEPDPTNFTKLEEHLEENAIQNVEIHSTALGETSSEQELYINPHNSGGHSFLEKEFGEHTTVKVVSLDETLQEERVDMVKIDVEGFELEVLMGMSKTLGSKHPEIICEVSRRFDEVSKLVLRYGYSIYTFKTDGSLAPLSESIRAQKDNYLFKVSQ